MLKVTRRLLVVEGTALNAPNKKKSGGEHFLDKIAKLFISEEQLLKGSKMTMKSHERVTPGYHWLVHRYQVPIWTELYYLFWQRFTGQVLVGKDWRGNLFFIQEDPTKLAGHERYGVFVEHWETEQDYDTDPLWQKWLQYRLASPPTAEQCAQHHKFCNEKYSMVNVVVDNLKKDNAEDPPGDRTRRYQEFADQKWDVRRARQVYNGAKAQQWYGMVMNNTEVADRDFYAREKACYEAWNFMQLDLLRPPRKQRLWKLENDARAARYINAIDNPNYKLDPYETTRKERYELSPSHVAGTEPPESALRYVVPPGYAEAGEDGVVQHSRSDRKPLQQFETEADYLKWFAEQRKHLIAARSELEQMKRDGFRPASIGGDLDPYAAIKPGLTRKQEKAQRTELLNSAREEQKALDAAKQKAASTLFETKQEEYQRLVREQDISFSEVAIKTKELGKIIPGSRKMFLEQRLTKVVPIPLDDDDTQADSQVEEVRTVFGERGKSLYGATTRKLAFEERPDNISLDSGNKTKK